MAFVVGYRFHPTEEELLEHYLSRRNQGGDTRDIHGAISTVDFCCIDPWQLPEISKIKSNENVWYFFGIRKNKYNSGGKQNRTTISGFWKKTGDTMAIIRNREGELKKIGEKRVLVFHLKNSRRGTKTGWIMHEYTSESHMENSICKIKFKEKKTEMSFNPGNEVALPVDNNHIAEGLSHQEGIDMPLNPTDDDVKRNEPLIIPMDTTTDPVFDYLEDIQGVDMNLDDSSNEQPYNNPLIHTMPCIDKLEEFLLGEELNEQASNAPLVDTLNLNGDTEILAWDWKVLCNIASNVPLVEDVQIDLEEINNAVDDKWKGVFDDEINPMQQQDLNDYNHQQSLGGVYESDDIYDWILSSMTASSSKRPRLDLPGTTIKSWSASDRFPSSNHRR